MPENNKQGRIEKIEKIRKADMCETTSPVWGVSQSVDKF
jgi:hypothetical protein